MRQSLGFCHRVSSGALIFLPNMRKIIRGERDRSLHHSSNVLRNLLSTLLLSCLVLPMLHPKP